MAWSRHPAARVALPSVVELRHGPFEKRAPSIVPGEEDQTVYLLLDDFRHLGRSWRETDVEGTDFETVVTDLLEGQYNNPVRVVVSTPPKTGPATSLKMSPMRSGGACDLQMREVPANLQDFVGRHEARRPATAPLV
jgi:hypothetical protein